MLLTAAAYTLMTKWVVAACELGLSNFKALLRYRLAQGQPYSHGNWPPLMEYAILDFRMKRLDKASPNMLHIEFSKDLKKATLHRLGRPSESLHLMAIP
jgi:hypothetical protein